MKHGFTLIELLVYMAIMGLVIVVAGRVFSDATGMRVRSQNMLASAEHLGYLSAIINEDISQMGAKAWGKNAADDYVVETSNLVYMQHSGANPDFSSYELKNRNDKFDSIVFRKMAFDDNGVFTDVREISWYATENGEIYRTECIVGESCFSEDAAKVLMGTGIKLFKLTPSTPGISPGSDTLFKPDGSPGFGFLPRETGNENIQPVKVSLGSSTVKVYGFAQNTDLQKMKFNQVYLTENNASACFPFSFNKGETYIVEFQMPIMGNENDSLITQFQPGVDHIAVGLRQANGTVFSDGPIDVQLYPMQFGAANQINMHAEFSPKTTMENACIAITFAFYSPLASKGSLHFQNFRVLRKIDETFHFANSNALQKENVKAFDMILEVERKGEKTSTRSDNGKGMVILTPNNGIKAKGRTLP
jgi:prepilin-type N-terminal cleavage/methylation domain-containing protein